MYYIYLLYHLRVLTISIFFFYFFTIVYIFLYLFIIMMCMIFWIVISSQIIEILSWRIVTPAVTIGNFFLASVRFSLKCVLCNKYTQICKIKLCKWLIISMIPKGILNENLKIMKRKKNICCKTINPCSVV